MKYKVGDKVKIINYSKYWDNKIKELKAKNPKVLSEIGREVEIEKVNSENYLVKAKLYYDFLAREELHKEWLFCEEDLAPLDAPLPDEFKKERFSIGDAVKINSFSCFPRIIRDAGKEGVPASDQKSFIDNNTGLVGRIKGKTKKGKIIVLVNLKGPIHEGDNGKMGWFFSEDDLEETEKKIEGTPEPKKEGAPVPTPEQIIETIKVKHIRKVEEKEITLADALAGIIQGHLGNALTDEDITSIARRVKEVDCGKEIIIKHETGERIKIGVQHFQFEEVLNNLELRHNVFISGPAGWGKTTAAKNAAKALGIPFYAMSVGPQTGKHEIFGMISATGVYCDTLFRKAYEKGGVFLFDEIDTANPAVMTAINSALEQDYCAFPDGMVQKHKDFMCIANGNTVGTGCNRIYVGRNQLDGATIDRFKFVEWEEDEKLEDALCPDADWLKYIRSLRRICEELEIPHIISPRASIGGHALIKQGKTPLKRIKEMVIWKGMDKEKRERILDKVDKSLKYAKGD